MLMQLALAVMATLALTVEDMDLIRAVEESIIDSLPHPRRLDDGMPGFVAEFVRDMGSPCAKCRDRATEAMEYISRKDIRWLFWGMRSTDPEIRSRCLSILARLPPRCDRCWGRGSTGSFSCYACHGSGRSWVYGYSDL